MLLILYKPKDNIVDYTDLLVDRHEAEDYLQDFPGSICVSYSSIDDFFYNFNTKCFNGMFGNYEIRNWLVPKKNDNFIILKHEIINI
jgi:hypothetical protein